MSIVRHLPKQPTVDNCTCVFRYVEFCRDFAAKAGSNKFDEQAVRKYFRSNVKGKR